MRYIKILLIAAFFFLAMVFFFQNQVPLSQDITLTFNLFFIPTMTAIPLPFYFIVVAAFVLGCILTLFMLAWDRLSIGHKYNKGRRRIERMEKKIKDLEDKLNVQNEKTASGDHSVNLAKQDDSPEHHAL
ncbi:MAG: LapA family protein [Desulfovibrio sp.]|nr:LapA family protein [Desulfovibrio sp.]